MVPFAMLFLGSCLSDDTAQHDYFAAANEISYDSGASSLGAHNVQEAMDLLAGTQLDQVLEGEWTGTGYTVRSYQGGIIYEVEGVWFKFEPDGTYQSNYGEKYYEVAGYPMDFNGYYRILGNTIVALTYWDEVTGATRLAPVDVSYSSGTLFVGRPWEGMDWYCALTKSESAAR